jgi:hypothetical protein
MSFPSDDFGLASNSLDDWSLLINTDLLNIENEAAPGPGFVIKQEAPSFNEPVKTQSSLLLPRQQMRGPTHNYSEYRQATSIVVDPLALQTTLQATQNTGYNFYDPIDTSMVDQDANIFNNTTVPSFNDNLSVSPLLPQLGDSPQANSANNSFASEPNTPLVQNNNQIRCYPGIHTQQAARYQSMEQRAQQVQEEQRWMQRQQSQEVFSQPSQTARSQMMASPPAQSLPSSQNINTSTSNAAKDPLRERVINQVLTDLRNAASLPPASVASDDLDRLRKEAKEEEDDMDPDAKLLNSEEGKKLPAMKRRQLRNKVSARAFRSRRKDYIAGLEDENNRIKAENAMLRNENAVLQSFVKDMLHRVPAFTAYLNTHVREAAAQLQANQQQNQPTQLSQLNLPQQQAPAQQQQTAALQEFDTTDYGLQFDFNSGLSASSNSSNRSSFDQNINLVQAPELDFSAVMNTKTDMPEPLDLGVLSGKTTNVVGSLEDFDVDEQKMELPSVEHVPAVVGEESVADDNVEAATDEEFETDPAFALYRQDDAPHTEDSGAALTDPSENSECLTMEEFQRHIACLEGVCERLTRMTM